MVTWDSQPIRVYLPGRSQPSTSMSVLGTAGHLRLTAGIAPLEGQNIARFPRKEKIIIITTKFVYFFENSLYITPTLAHPSAEVSTTPPHFLSDLATNSLLTHWANSTTKTEINTKIITKIFVICYIN